ncbi:MAG TPA: DUF192 domain-containing protein [Caulobacteraceae bacterium]|jgi:hypothetical protein
MSRLIPLGALLLAAACARETTPAADPVDPAPPVAAAPAGPPVLPASAPERGVPLPPDAPRVTPGPVEPLEIVTAAGPVRFQVELADTPAEREQGLMWRGSMPVDRGMIFDFPGETEQGFWMRNTYIPLDIIYIRADGRIHSIARSTTPLSEALVPSGGPVKAVLEINGGLSERLGIAPGDLVRHRIFPSQ